MRGLVPALLVLLGLVVFGGGLAARGGVDDIKQERDAERGTSRALAQPVREQCAASGDAQPSPEICELAKQVVTAPAPETPPAGLNQEQVLALIRAELARLPLPPGQPPTDEQVRAAAETVLLAHPDLFRGPPPDPEQLRQLVDAAVDSYFAANPPQRGPQGIGIFDIEEPGRDGERCVIGIVLLDPATGETSRVQITVPDAFCDPGDPPPAPTPTPTPGPTAPPSEPQPSPAPEQPTTAPAPEPPPADTDVPTAVPVPLPP